MSISDKVSPVFKFLIRRYLDTKKGTTEDFHLSSSASTRISLKAVYDGEAGLSEKRKKLLMRVPNPDDWAEFALESITTKDIAYLSAATHHEFALLRGKKQDILFHGTNYHCDITDDMIELLKEGKLYLVAHTHPDYGKIKPSADDRKFLQRIGQKKSLIVSYITGAEREFNDNIFENVIDGR